MGKLIRLTKIEEDSNCFYNENTNRCKTDNPLRTVMSNL